MIESRKPLIAHGIVVDARNQPVLMPDGTFRYWQALVVGASHFNRIGDNRPLPWKPMMVLVEFNAALAKAPGYSGYAKPLSVRAKIIRVHLLLHSHDYRKATNIQTRLHREVGNLLAHRLAGMTIQSPRWPARRERLVERVQQYRRDGGDLTALLCRCHRVVASFGGHHAHFLDKTIADCRQAAFNAERALDRKLTVAYLFVQPTKVINLLSPRLDVERAFKPRLNDAAQVDDPAYIRAQFQQVQALKAYYREHHLPLYPEARLDQAHWAPASDAVYETFGVLA